MIFEGNYTDYLMLFGDFRTAHSDLAARLAAAGGGGAISLLLEDDRPAGFVCRAEDGDAVRISYLFVTPERRRRGAGRALLERTLATTDRPVRLSLAEGIDGFDEMQRLAKAVGFRPENTSVAFRSGIERDWTYWDAFMAEKGDDWLGVIGRMGYRAHSFRDAPRPLLAALYDSARSDYQNRLDVRPFFDFPERRMDFGLSFVAEKGGVLAAYTLVTRPDEKSAVFEHMSASAENGQIGCVFLPIARSMAACKAGGITRMAYTMYEDNDRANALRRKLFDRVTVYSHRTFHYIYRRS